MISPLAFQKAVQRCRSAMELMLHDNTKSCNTETWRYFTLMLIFSSLTGMLSLLSLYLYIKIREKIRKKKSLEKETRVLRQQGMSAWAAAATIGVGRQRAEYTQQEPVILVKPAKKGKGKKKKLDDNEGETTTASTSNPTWKPGMPGYPYSGYGGFSGIAAEDGDMEFE